MKIKIDSNGKLSINNEKKYCPYRGNDGNLHCGTWCALFSEPREWEEIDGINIIIELCQANSWICNKLDFTDERIKTEEEK